MPQARGPHGLPGWSFRPLTMSEVAGPQWGLGSLFHFGAMDFCEGTFLLPGGEEICSKHPWIEDRPAGALHQPFERQRAELRIAALVETR